MGNDTGIPTARGWRPFVDALRQARTGDVVFAVIPHEAAQRSMRTLLSLCLQRRSIRYDALLFLLWSTATDVPGLFAARGLIHSTGWASLSPDAQRTALARYLQVWQRPQSGPLVVWTTEQALDLFRENGPALWEARRGIYDLRETTWGEILALFPRNLARNAGAAIRWR
jgi:hypothetical protein